MAKRKQKQVINEMVANGGVLEPAVAKVYSKAYARSGKIVKTKTWQELMEAELPDDDLLKVNKEGLIATVDKPIIIGRDDKGKPEYEYVEKPDFNARHKYLETAYKIKGKIKEFIPSAPPTNININFFSNPRIQQATKLYEETLKQAIINGNQKPLEILPNEQALGNN